MIDLSLNPTALAAAKKRLICAYLDAQGPVIDRLSEVIDTLVSPEVHGMLAEYVALADAIRMQSQKLYISVLHTRGYTDAARALTYSGMKVISYGSTTGFGWMVLKAESESAAQYQADRFSAALVGAVLHSSEDEARSHLHNLVLDNL